MKRLTSIFLGIVLWTGQASAIVASQGEWYSEAVRDFISRDIPIAEPLRPNDDARRWEFVDLVVRAKSGNYAPTSSSFDDIHDTDSYAGVFEYAAQQGWVKGGRSCYGSHPCFAKPLDTLTRAEAAAILNRVFSLRDTETKPTTILSDVPEWKWYATDVRIAAAHCILRGDAETHMIRPEDAMNRAEMMVMIHRALQSNGSTSCGAPLLTVQPPQELVPASTPAESGGRSLSDLLQQFNLPASQETPIASAPEDHDANSAQGTGSALKVALHSPGPIGDRVAIGATSLHVFSLDLTAPCTKDASIDGIIVARYGMGRMSDIDGIWARSGKYRISPVAKMLAQDGAAHLNFPEPLIIKACTTKTVDILANLTTYALSQSQHHFSIDFSSDISSNVSEVTGNFPLESSTFRVSSLKSGVLSVTYMDIPDVPIQTRKQVIARFEVGADSKEDQVIYRMEMENMGTALDGDFVNLFVRRADGTRLTDYIAQTTNDSVSFSFDPPEKLKAGTKEIYEVTAHTFSGTGDTIRLHFKNPSDILSVGSFSGYGGMNAQLYGSTVVLHDHAAIIRLKMRTD